MLLSMCSDYARDRGNAEQDLSKIADAGFDGIQWIHQWNTDFIYTRAEIRQIGRWLKTFNLKMFDLHATDGVEKRWLTAMLLRGLSSISPAARSALTGYLR